MTDIEYSWLDPTRPAEVDASLELVNRSVAANVPTFPTIGYTARIMDLFLTSTKRRQRYLLAKRAGELVAVAELMLPLSDNTHLAEMELDVEPQLSGRGVGSAVLEEVERYLRSEGRRTLVAYVPQALEGAEPLPSYGPAFARARGFEAATVETRRTADLDAVDEGEMDRLLADSWSKAEGYELEQWSGPTAERNLADVAYLDSRLYGDAPSGTLDMESYAPDPERISENDQNRRRRGQLAVHTVLRHRESGRIAAWTDIVVNPDGDRDAWQGITLVDPEHRGHRLGTILKIENHRQLRRHRPYSRYVHTWNDAANEHMIAINEAVGYRAMEHWTAFQKKLE